MPTQKPIHMVCWLPWLPIASRLEMGPVLFQPFCTQDPGPFKLIAKDLRRVMSRFRDIYGKPVQKLAIAVLQEKFDLPVLDDESLEQVQKATLLLMLASTASIRHFSHILYTNTSVFELVVEKFARGSPYTTVVGRRRDGQSVDGGYVHGEIIHQQPRATHLCRVLPCEPEFLTALSGAIDSTKVHHQKVLLSLGPYRLANTDDYQIADTNELVLSQWAIEHLIGPCNRNRDFQDKLDNLLKGYVSAVADASSRPDNDTSTADMPRDKWLLIRQWAWELYELRSVITHGSAWQSRPWRWSIFEHGLFAAWLYPLLVKLVLYAKGDYALTGSDKAALKTIDPLLADSDWRKNWAQILSHSGLGLGIEMAVEKAFGAHGDKIQKSLDALEDAMPDDDNAGPPDDINGTPMR